MLPYEFQCGQTAEGAEGILYEALTVINGEGFNVNYGVRNDAGVALEINLNNSNGDLAIFEASGCNICFIDECYLKFLRKNVEGDYVENLHIIYHQHDEVPPHNVILINNHLRDLFYDQWIAEKRSHLWPPRSPDLSVLDYFIWGTVKNEVFNTAATTVEDSTHAVRQNSI
ncbi:hypothetical protein WA026_023655 [Henosepilachna vigintioctopunctata]|uniref:Uncharacterized protein n=1 Tax=Henosepilachna vigintioctopunctata TaxID=420089 RepID=A0AAW1VJ21_9CUCU